MLGAHQLIASFLVCHGLHATLKLALTPHPYDQAGMIWCNADQKHVMTVGLISLQCVAAGWHMQGGSEPDLPATASVNNQEGYVPLYD